MTQHNVSDLALSYNNLINLYSDLRAAHEKMELELEQSKTLIVAISKSNDRERTNSFSLQRENLKLHRKVECYEEITKAYCFFTECSAALGDILDSHDDDYSNDDYVQTARDRLILLFHITLKSIIDGSSQLDARSSIDPMDTASFRPASNVDDIPF